MLGVFSTMHAVTSIGQRRCADPVLPVCSGSSGHSSGGPEPRTFVMPSLSRVPSQLHAEADLFFPESGLLENVPVSHYVLSPRTWGLVSGMTAQPVNQIVFSLGVYLMNQGQYTLFC